MSEHTWPKAAKLYDYSDDEVMDTIDSAIDGRIFRSAEDAIECILSALEHM